MVDKTDCSKLCRAERKKNRFDEGGGRNASDALGMELDTAPNAARGHNSETGTWEERAQDGR